MTYIDTKAHENVPDGMACHACKIESARIELFRKPVDVYNVCVLMQIYPFPPNLPDNHPGNHPHSQTTTTLTDNNTQQIHGNTNGSFLEKGHGWEESIFGNQVKHRYTAGERHWQEHSDTQPSIFLGIPQLEEGHNDTGTTDHRGEDHIPYLGYRMTVKAIVFSDEDRCRNENSDANVVLCTWKK